MELVVAQIFISLPHRLTVVLGSRNENAFGAKTVRRPGSEGNSDFVGQSDMGLWPGLMGQEGLKDSSRQCLKHFPL